MANVYSSLLNEWPAEMLIPSFPYPEVDGCRVFFSFGLVIPESIAIA